jgi:transposase
MANATGRPIARLILSPAERTYLERQVRRHRVARSLSERCRVILRCADGVPSKAVANELGLHEHTVGKWRRRFLKDRIEGLLDEARPVRPRTIDDDQVAAVIERTLRSMPRDATHWSIRSMATETGPAAWQSGHYGFWADRRTEAVVGQNRVDDIRNGGNKLFEKGGRHRHVRLVEQPYKGELRRAVYGDEKIELSCRRLDFGDVDVKEANRIGFELLL